MNTPGSTPNAEATLAVKPSPIGGSASQAPALELRGVFAGYGPFRALCGVSLSLPAGGALALLGANGAGKTTIARVASGLITPTEGRVSVGGTDRKSVV